MESFKYIIKDKVGLHARPAGQMVKLIKSFSGSEIRITKGDKSVNATQLMKLMGMGIKCGDEITITVNGGDEQAALEAMQNFMEEHL